MKIILTNIFLMMWYFVSVTVDIMQSIIVLFTLFTLKIDQRDNNQDLHMQQQLCCEKVCSDLKANCWILMKKTEICPETNFQANFSNC